tara:strand:- start:227 stop:754 length:528 start_codon:yes stop_codon:yes gene_type:complete
MRLDKIILILLISLLTACSSTGKKVNHTTEETPSYEFTRSHLGVVLGGATGAGACIELIGTDPYIAAGCAVVGAFVGANILYQSDFDLHQAVFVDHLNNGPSSASYTNWFSTKSGNNGTIKINRSYVQGPLICKEYESNWSIKSNWPVVGIGNSYIDTRFGTVCQMPDGRWIEKR